jgi:hypothetical protein
LAELYVVEVHGGEYDSSFTHQIKAFRDLTRADMFLVNSEEDHAAEEALLIHIHEWIEEFCQSYPEPQCRYVEVPSDARPFADLSEDYETQVAFLQPIYNEAYRQEWNAWFEIWYGALEGKLAAIGKKPFFEPAHKGDGRQDCRNFGRGRHAYPLSFSISTLELEE